MNEHEYPPLIDAVEEGNLLQAQRLLEQGVDPNAMYAGAAPLHKAVAQDHLEMVKLLLTAGADVNPPDIDDYRPLAFARSTQAINLLFAAGADPELQDGLGRNQIDLLANLGGFDLALYAHRRVERERPGYRGMPLHAAACLRNFERMQTFITGGTPATVVDPKGRTPLHWLASGQENEGAAQIILHHWAETTGEQDDVNAKAPFEQCAQLLLDHGANIEARDANQNTPLLAAMQWGEHEIARYLVRQGAQVAVTDVTGWTPVILAANRDDVPLLAFLLEHGGTLEEQRAGWGPLNYAAHHGKHTMVRYLLDRGVDPNRVWDSTLKHLQLPIHSAAFMGDLATIKLLLEGGATTDAKDGNGNTPLDLALQQQNFDKELNALIPGFADPGQKPWNQIIEVLKNPDQS